MKTKQPKPVLIAFATLLLCVVADHSFAQDVKVRLSAREVYVGIPVVLQVSISNASDYHQPAIPEIDGCDVRSAGAPSTSSQISIINGRRSENRSVTFQYLVTPRRAGTFEIPSLTIKVDGRDEKTEPVRFVATKSETGDLLFVEIEGGKDKVFVGQSLDLTLRIWVKPYVDREQNIKLTEADMWRMISEQTSWGSFAKRLKELAEDNQRPGGRKVLRDDGNGSEREYYLYEIETTVYPKRPGRIDADDVQIVVSYPTSLRKSRDPFADFFDDSPFGGSLFGSSSRLKQMMDDDFFSSSPFGNRLSVSKTPPVVAEANVGSTEVLPVPTRGRPADYRGAVGRYKIVTHASPTAVSAGDPITLNIGVVGTGPMELVQAPPLSEMSALTADFKIADQSLAGFVEDQQKVFPTTIRPRREGITRIPAISFSFFDPETEKFETVKSDPISITVDHSESLALDAIVDSEPQSLGKDQTEATTVRTTLEPDFTNDDAASVLISQTTPSFQWWWAFVVLPPVIWLATLLVRNRTAMTNGLPSFKSAFGRCLAALDRAKDWRQVEQVLLDYLAHRTGKRELTTSTSVGELRLAGMHELANEVESFFQSCENSAYSGANEQSPADLQQEARRLTEKMELSFASNSKSQVRQSNHRGHPGTTSKPDDRFASPTQKASILLLAALLVFSPTIAYADLNGQVAGDAGIQLSELQRKTVLKEAGEIYSRATAVAETDSAEANRLFVLAAVKYQLLVDSGICNAGLYLNLGNAYLKSNQLGQAIANYERARKLAPTNQQLLTNLNLANSLVKGQAPAPIPVVKSWGWTGLHSVVHRFRSWNNHVYGFIPLQAMIWVLVLASSVFWGICIVRAAGYRIAAKRLAVVPLILLMSSLTSVMLATTSGFNGANGIVVANNVTLHAGDGEQFDEVISFDQAQGHRVHVLARRGNWTQVKTMDGHIGWVDERNVGTFNGRN